MQTYKIGNFFAIDHRCWNYICDNLGINEAISYLILARGSLKNQKSSSWSVNAIEKYTNISRMRAKKAIENLQHNHLITNIKSDKKKPFWHINPAYEVPKTTAYIEKLTNKEVDLLKYIPNEGIKIPTYTKLKEFGNTQAHYIASDLVKKKYLIETNKYFFKPISHNEDFKKPIWIWLPNEIITGLKDYPISPIEQIRQTGNFNAIRLFIDLYAEHFLKDNGGIDWRILYESYSKQEIYNYAQYIILGFKRDTFAVRPNKATFIHNPTNEKDHYKNIFWPALYLLEQLKLISCIPHLIENSSDTAEIIHPYAIKKEDSNLLEYELFLFSHHAALHLLNKGRYKFNQKDTIDSEEPPFLIPVLSHQKDVQLIGIFRLKYKPKTSATSEWIKKNQIWQDYIKVYQKIREN